MTAACLVVAVQILEGSASVPKACSALFHSRKGKDPLSKKNLDLINKYLKRDLTKLRMMRKPQERRAVPRRSSLKLLKRSRLELRS